MISTLQKLFKGVLPDNIKRSLSGKPDKEKMAKRKQLLMEGRKTILADMVKNVHDHQYLPYKDEIEYLASVGDLVPFPYPNTGVEPEEVIGDFDEVRKLPYVIHKGKRLFFHKGFSLERAKKAYLNYISVENILGGGYLKKSPHQYLTNDFCVKDGDILMDVGAAEGLFLLDNIDKIKKGYLFEASAKWNEALMATFEPYLNKVEIINKYATNLESTTETTLDACLKGEKADIFIKIDVEGYEMRVLEGATNTLNSKKDIRIACCTYHKKDDAQVIEKFCTDKDYSCEFSDGYMLYYFDKDIQPPYFRKGLLRARKNG